MSNLVEPPRSANPGTIALRGQVISSDDRSVSAYSKSKTTWTTRRGSVQMPTRAAVVVSPGVGSWVEGAGYYSMVVGGGVAMMVEAYNAEQIVELQHLHDSEEWRVWEDGSYGSAEAKDRARRKAKRALESIAHAAARAAVQTVTQSTRQKRELRTMEKPRYYRMTRRG